MSKLALYGYWRSSCSYRVRIALNAKGLSYAYHAVNLVEQAQSQAAYTEKSPTGYVPCLVIDGEAFVESMAILELLEDLHPEPRLLPRDPGARAHVRALCEIVNAGIQPLQNLNVIRRVSEDFAQQKAWMQHFIGKGLRAFETRLARLEESGVSGPFSYGEAFGLADCLLVPQVYAARRNSVDLSGMPRVMRADAAASALDFVRAAHPDLQPDARP